MIALLEAYRAGLFAPKSLAPDIVAGVVVGIVAMPLAMAFAIASGATPAQGLYTAIIAGLATAAFGGTRVQISGPTGAFIAVLASITAQYGIAGLQIVTLMAGVILLAMGLARLGGVIRFIQAGDGGARSAANPRHPPVARTAGGDGDSDHGPGQRAFFHRRDDWYCIRRYSAQPPFAFMAPPRLY